MLWYAVLISLVLIERAFPSRPVIDAELAQRSFLIVCLVDSTSSLYLLSLP